MRRESVNFIRYVLEEWIPPVLRDSAPMRWLFRGYWGRFVDDLEKFRANIHHVTPAEYADIYRRMPRIQHGTDNSEACIARLAELLTPGTVCDVGCGTGYLVGELSRRSARPAGEFTGVDFQLEPGIAERVPGAHFREADIEALPFADGAFSTVVCTHVLEHVLDIGKTIAQLRRVAAQRLLVIVPLEREYRFTFNPHVHFFPYPHSFLRHIVPVPKTARCEVIGRDLLYIEERQGA
ncbi:MAG TPA: class I SAM-dependent methyltransferase [Steroidobacteraceae bacterium]|nr:class I SAM-dependent methyltransferase [Steroidobacteraceae bacterium]